jgi:pilus assembly protein FimV
VKPAPAPASPSLTEFELDVPEPTIGDPRRPTPASDFNMDFNLEPLPPINVPGETRQAQSKPTENKAADAKPLDISLPDITAAVPAEAKAAAAAPAPSTDLDFKLDDISLDFGGSTPTRQVPKDDHWYDVQQKFDLAKAYEEMGDKDGARDILQEVVKEGDAQQQSQAKTLLGALS